MKKLLAAAVWAVLLVCLAGAKCASLPPANTEYKVIAPEAKQVVDCDVAEPPEADTYSFKTEAEKEKALYEYAEKLQNNLNKCNVQWSELRIWIDKMMKLYAKKPTP